MRWFYLIMIIAILASLFSALFALIRPAEKTNPRTVKALTLRVALSISLFLILAAVKTWELTHG